MKVKRLEIRERESWEPGTGELTGFLEVGSPKGTIKVALTDDMIAEMFKVIADKSYTLVLQSVSGVEEALEAASYPIGLRDQSEESAR